MNRLLITASLWLWALAVVSQAALGDGSGRPNIVLVLVDDQETVMNTIDHMPNVQEHLVDKGTSFERHYCTGKLGQAPPTPLPLRLGSFTDLTCHPKVAVCCPSRVNLWTGQMAHNTNVTALNPPYGST